MRYIAAFFVFIACLLFLESKSSAQNVRIRSEMKTLVITNPGKVISDAESPVLGDGKNYTVYKLVDPNGIGIRAEKLDDVRVTKVELKNNAEQVWVTIDKPLAFDTIYLINVVNATWGGKKLPVMRLEPSTQLSLKPYNTSRDSIYIESNVGMRKDSATVSRITLAVSADHSEVDVASQPIETRKVESKTPFQMVATYKDKLPEARNHYLIVQTTADDKAKDETGNKELTAATKIAVAGLPQPNPKPVIDLTLASEFGGNLKPQFNFSGGFRHRLKASRDEVFLLEPTVSFDLGLGATKSKNSIILDLPTLNKTFDNFKRTPGCSLDKAPELKPTTGIVADPLPVLTDGKHHTIPLPCYSSWMRRPVLRIYSVDLRAGPRFEMDRRLARVNALGAARISINFDRWQHSIAAQRAYLQTDLLENKEFKDFKDFYKDVVVRSGYEITPQFGIEAGRKLTAEVFQNKAKTVHFVIPQYAIFRAFAGLTQVYEWQYHFLPIKLSLTENLYYLGRTEIVGEIKDNRLDLRSIRGFQPYGKATFEFSFDPAKRYSFTITYENGRSAPNFEYLNSVKSGIRVQY